MRLRQLGCSNGRNGGIESQNENDEDDSALVNKCVFSLNSFRLRLICLGGNLADEGRRLFTDDQIDFQCSML